MSSNTENAKYNAVREFAKLMLPGSPGSGPAEVRYGVIWTVEGDGTCTVFLSGDVDAPIAGVRRLRTFIVPGDIVLMLKSGPEYTVVASLSDQSEGIYQAWDPIIGQGAGTPNIAHTISYGKFWRTGNRIEVQARIQLTAAGTAGGTIVMSNLPFPGNPNAGVVGVGHIGNGGLVYRALMVWLSSTQWVFGPTHVTTAANIGVAPNIGLANGDVISIHATYEAL